MRLPYPAARKTEFGGNRGAEAERQRYIHRRESLSLLGMLSASEPLCLCPLRTSRSLCRSVCLSASEPLRLCHLRTWFHPTPRSSPLVASCRGSRSLSRPYRGGRVAAPAPVLGSGGASGIAIPSC